MKQKTSKNQSKLLAKITKIFLAAIDKVFGEEFYSKRETLLFDFSPVLATLPDVKLKTGYKIFARRHFKVISRHSGDFFNLPTFFKVFSCKGEVEKEYSDQFFDAFEIPFTPAGVWQWFLLENAWRLMPTKWQDVPRIRLLCSKKMAMREVFWERHQVLSVPAGSHSHYSFKRTREDVKKIRLSKSEKKRFESLFPQWRDEDFWPSVKILSGGNAEIKCKHYCLKYDDDNELFPRNYYDVDEWIAQVDRNFKLRMNCDELYWKYNDYKDFCF